MEKLHEHFGIFKDKSDDNKFSVLPKYQKNWQTIKSNIVANSTLVGAVHVEDNGFCHDIK